MAGAPLRSLGCMGGYERVLVPVGISLVTHGLPAWQAAAPAWRLAMALRCTEV